MAFDNRFGQRAPEIVEASAEGQNEEQNPSRNWELSEDTIKDIEAIEGNIRAAELHGTSLLMG